MIDRNTRWIDVAELKDIYTTTVAAAFVKLWILSYGVPVTFITDSGTQFTGDMWTRMCSQLHISHCTTTSYHPESNDFIENLHRSLKVALQAKCQTASWSTELPLILLDLQSVSRETDANSNEHSAFHRFSQGISGVPQKKTNPGF